MVLVDKLPRRWSGLLKGWGIHCSFEGLVGVVGKVCLLLLTLRRIQTSKTYIHCIVIVMLSKTSSVGCCGGKSVADLQESSPTEDVAVLP